MRQSLCDKYDVHIQNNGSKICVSLREYHDCTFAENQAAAYTACFGPHRKLILTAIIIFLKIMYIQKIEK